MKIFFVTNNAHKLEEVQALCGTGIDLKNLNDLGCSDEIPETGNTFKANASQKSRFVFHKYQVNCFADDSGLEVDALNGEPGVDSAHYSGSRDAKENLELVLSNLGDTENRKARFKTVISLILDGEEHFFEGVAEGSITKEKTGIDGFGYDPIFRPDGHERTFAEMSLEEKNRISHRAKAMQKLIAFLQERIS